MRKTKVHVVEVVPDAGLRKKEAKARAVVKRFFPNAGPLRLYRTAEGQVGCQLDVTVTAGDRTRLDEAYQAIMKALGEKRGRPRGVRKVQTKLMLPEPAYLALKRAAAAQHETMSGLVTQLAEGLSRTCVR
jgi:hypothetical protein